MRLLRAPKKDRFRCDACQLAEGDHDAYFDAGVYACRNQSDEAFHWLERAYADRSALLPYLKTEVTLRSITADARFKALLQKMNLPE